MLYYADYLQIISKYILFIFLILLPILFNILIYFLLLLISSLSIRFFTLLCFHNIMQYKRLLGIAALLGHIGLGCRKIRLLCGSSCCICSGFQCLFTILVLKNRLLAFFVISSRWGITWLIVRMRKILIFHHRLKRSKKFR